MKFLIISLLLFILLRLPSIFEPYWYLDENIYLAIGRGVTQGLKLYHQLFDHKPPSIYYLSSLFPSLTVAKIFLSLWTGLTVYFFYRLANKVLSLSLAKISTLMFIILTAIPLLEGNIFNAEIINLLPTILGFFLYFQKRSIVISGVLFGLAFTFKTPSFFDFLLFLFLIKPKNIPQALTGFFAPISLWATYFSLNHQFGALLHSAFFSNYNYISSWSTHFFLPQIFLIITAFFFLRRPRSSFPLLWFVFTTIASTISSRPYPHYLIQVIPPLCLLLVSGFPYLLFTLLVYLIAIRPVNFYRYRTWDYYANFYQYLFGKKSFPDYVSYFSPDIPSITQVSQFVSQNSRPNDYLYLWGNYPQIYFQSHLRPASKYLTTFHIDQFKDHPYLIDQLKLTSPKFIIVSHQSEPFAELSQFINRHYYLQKDINNFLIYHQL